MLNDLMLIDLVRRNGILYDKSYGGHRNPMMKKATWTNIAIELGASEEVCIKRWTSLRERYSREYKRIIEQANDNTIQTFAEPWPLYEAMTFLKDHVKQRGSRNTYSYLEDSVSLHANSLTSASPNLEYIDRSPKTYDEVPPKLEFSIESPKPDYSSSTEKYSDDPKASTSTERVRKRKANSSFDFEEEFREERRSYQASNHCQELINEKKNVAVHAFGQMIVATICELSGKKQAQAMKQITDIVMTLKMEEEEERGSQND